MGLQVHWSQTSKQDVELIYHFYQEKSQSAADRILLEIVQIAESIKYPHQYQQDDLNPNYRRMIVRHFKILYNIANQQVYIMRIFDTRQDPEKMNG